MYTKILLEVQVYHTGELSPDELAQTVGSWVGILPHDSRRIETETDDGIPCTLTIQSATGSVPSDRIY